MPALDGKAASRSLGRADSLGMLRVQATRTATVSFVSPGQDSLTVSDPAALETVPGREFGAQTLSSQAPAIFSTHDRRAQTPAWASVPILPEEQMSEVNCPYSIPEVPACLLLANYRGAGEPGTNKWALHRIGRRFLLQVAKALGQEGYVDAVKGTPSTSGHVILQTPFVLIRMSEGAMCRGLVLEFRRRDAREGCQVVELAALQDPEGMRAWISILKRMTRRAEGMSPRLAA